MTAQSQSAAAHTWKLGGRSSRLHHNLDRSSIRAPSSATSKQSTPCPTIRLHCGAHSRRMLSRRIVRATPFSLRAARALPVTQRRTFLPEEMNGKKVIEQQYPSSDYPSLTAAEDPNMNGGYVNPPRIKRQFRDPHGDWWDKQERRNYGEPVHEDHDILGMFSPYEYTWTTPGKGLLQIGAFVVTFLSVLAVVKMTYPDKVSYPREFEGGLLEELGGVGAMRARQAGDPDP